MKRSGGFRAGGLDQPRRAAVLGLIMAAGSRRALAGSGSTGDRSARLAELERRSEGRLGVSASGLEGAERVGYRAEERFPLASTFKLLAAACVLSRVDRGEENLDRRIRFGAEDLVPYSPLTAPRIGGEGMTLSEICAAAIAVSDNTAGNLMLASFGGPAGLTAYLRGLGDERSRLDRNEPDLNQNLPGDPRDTTTPAAMLGNLRRLLVEDALRPASRGQLIAWLIACTTGGARLRAGFPSGWVVGDKTGTGENGAVADVAIAWPPSRPPVLAAAYFVGPGTPEARSAVIAEAGRILTGQG